MALTNLSKTDLFAFVNAYNNVLNAVKILKEKSETVMAIRYLNSAIVSFKELEPKTK